MQFSLATILALPLLVSASFWTIKDYTLTSDANLSLSTLSYTILTPTENQTCIYNISATKDLPSTRAPYSNVACGAFVIGSGWSGQFGPENGFTTLSIQKGNEITWPAFDDRAIVNGTKVSPDRSFEVILLG